MGSGTVSASSLSNLGSTAVMIFGIDHGDAAIDVAGSLQNQGAMHSGGNLVLNAASLSNSNTAGISSLANATITTSSGGISNAGALYAAGKLSTSALNQTITNTSSGTMDATDIALSAGTFDNYNSVISTNNTAIKTTVAFNNLPTGAVPNIVTDYITYDGYTLPHDTGEYNCNIFGAACDHLWVYAQNYHVIQKLDRPMPSQTGVIIAGNTIDIDFGASASNVASLISAPNINITGSGTFTNRDLHLEQIDYARRWRDYKTNSTFGDLEHDYRYATTAAEIGNCNDGGCFSGSAGSFDGARDAAYGLETKRTTIKTWRAGIYATNLNFAAGGLQNLGSPYQQATTATTGSGTTAASGTTASGAGVAGIFGAVLPLKAAVAAGAAGTSKGVTVAAANGISFTGLNLTLPTNPNGYFVQAKDPTANYLVETNPLFQVGSNSVGSDYLSKLLGIDPEKQQKRLGDSNYEAKLVRDQLIAQTGNNILKGMKNEAAQMQALMDQATTQSKSLGLVYGQPLTKEQAAGLTEDIVWMVEQTVNGQKVLAPVVYLASSTRDAIETGGPVISATNASIKADTLANTGGTIKGDTLAIETKGDLVNTGGKIKGGDVSVKSTEGSIINQTVAETNGGKAFARTVIGATGSIESTGNLSLDAAKDITVKGANVKAGGDATLAAGGAVTLDTIQDKRVDSTYKASQGLWGLSSSSESTRTATTTNIGSSLETGGSLKIKSGGDTTIAGSNVKTGGDLDLAAGGNVNVVSRQDTVEKSVSTSHSGLGVGGGLYGSTNTTTDSFKGRNVASGIEVGGNASIATDNTMTVQGSKLKVAGDANIAAGDVQVLAGQDVDRTTSVTTTTSFLKISGEGKADSGASAGSNAGANAASSNKNGKAQASAQAGAGASAGAEASASASAGLTLAETTTTNTYDYKSKAVGSELDIGGNLKVDSKKDITLQGATVNTGGDADLKAKGDVKILASQDIDISTSKTTTTQIGLYVDSDNKASASAEASASAGAKAGSDRYGSAASANAQAGARAGAEASSDTNIDVVRTMTTEKNSLNVTNTGTTINAGGKLKVDAGNQLAVQGSDIGGEQGVSLKAKDMSFTAAEDISVTTTKTTKTSAGLYISGSASAEAGASASAGAHASNDAGGTNMGMNASAEAGASAEAKIGAGIQARHSTESSTEGTTTARVSTIRSGSGDIERNATGKILDVGTAIEAGGDFSQTADTIESRAARNTTFSSSESQSDSMRLGVYASANAEAKAGASASAEAGSGMLGPGMASNNKSESEAGANAAIGVEAQYKHASSSSSSSSSEAVVSTIKTGGKVSSKSTNATVLEGTQISGDGGVELEAKSIDFKAAKNTETSSDSSLNVDVHANVGLNLGSDGAVDGGLGGGFDKGSGSASSSTAVAGSIQSGAGLRSRRRATRASKVPTSARPATPRSRPAAS
ncbi:hemagglutinin repeat-containing protein [Massilia sp. TN1-12]|uniref:hemagglutinin repeat-containing protein n=1 Tax=Massilia paldalensis TaxID=3377675 RepID=UPI00384B0866